MDLVTTCGLVMLSVGLLASRRNPDAQPTDALEGYKSYNAIIVSVAILCSYIAGLWIDNIGGRRWRQYASVSVAFAICSVFVSSSLSSHGRGGWLAFAAGFGYILWKRTQTFKTLAIIFIVGLASVTAYETLPNFQSLVDLTLSPPDDTIATVGGRWRAFLNMGARGPKAGQCAYPWYRVLPSRRCFGSVGLGIA